MYDVTRSSFLFSDYDPAFLTNFGPTFTHNITGQHYVATLPQIPVLFVTLPNQTFISNFQDSENQNISTFTLFWGGHSFGWSV